MRFRRANSMIVIAVLCVVSTACTEDSDTEPAATSLVISGAASPSEATAPNSGAESSESSDPSAVSTESSAGPTTDPPPQSADDAQPATETDRLPIRTETPLDAGSYRTTKLAGPSVAIDVDLPVDGLFAIDEEGALSIGTDGGAFTLVTIFHLDNGAALEPTADTNRFADREYADSVSSPIPDDALAWLQQRPGVSAGQIEDTEFGGVPARRLSLVFGAFDGARPCGQPNGLACHFLLVAPPTGFVLFNQVGDGLDVFEMTVGGHRLLVMIDTTYDPAASADIADSIRFTVVPHPAASAASVPLPFTGPLSDRTQYVSERSSGGIWLISGLDGVEVSTGHLRDRFVRFESDGQVCGSLTDASQGSWFAQELLPGDRTARPGVAMPGDIGPALEASPAIEIVAGPVQVPLGALAGVAYDVRPVGDADVILASTSMPATSGSTTRIVALQRDDTTGTQLVMVTVGSPCEALLDGLEFIPGAER